MRNLSVSIPFLVVLLAFSCSTPKEVTPKEPTVSKRQLEKCEDQLSSLQNQLNDKDASIRQLQQENQNLGSKIAANEQELQRVTAKMQESSDDYGIWFRVQIGAYKDRRIDKDLETTDELSLEEREDIQKISLGRFRNYEDAKKLKNELKGMGLKDAWIVSYKDGKRITIEEALGNE